MDATPADQQVVYRSEEACAFGHAIITVWFVDYGYVGEVQSYNTHGFGPWRESQWQAGHDAWQCWDEMLLSG